MRIFVDELPKSCGDCVFCKQTEYYCYCDKLHTKLGYINKEKDCPLQSLADYTKQVRKEVCEQITEELLDVSHQYWKTFLKNGVQYMTSDDLYEFLEEINNKIQGEKHDK